LNYRGKPISENVDQSRYRSHEIGFIFQSFHLLPTFTALENVQIPMFEMGWSASVRRERALTLLGLVGLDKRAHHFPTKLSGGERQRVAIARSLANNPSVLLADEPTGNLDSANSVNVLDLLERIHAEKNMTTVLITHDMSIAKRASRTIWMRDGKIVSGETTHAAAQI